MTHPPTSYIVQKNTYLKQMLDSDFGHPCLATFHSPFCMANLAKGTPGYARLDRWKSQGHKVTKVEVVMPHSEYTHLAQKLNNMSPCHHEPCQQSLFKFQSMDPLQQNGLHSQKKKVWIEISIQFQIFQEGPQSVFLQQIITLGISVTLKKKAAPSTSRLRSAPPPTWEIAAFNSMDPPKKTNLHLQGTKGSQTFSFCLKKLAASVCWTKSTDSRDDSRSGLQQGLWLSPGSGLIPGKVFGGWHGFITGNMWFHPQTFTIC